MFTQFFASDKGVLVICVAMSLLALFLNRKASILAIDGPHDRLRYIGMAQTIIDGHWLGAYNHMTLIRLPTYPIFLALNSIAGWRLHVFQHSVYLLSILLLVAALRAVDIARWRVIFVCVLCVFHPIPFYGVNLVATELIYTPSATAVIAGCLGLLGSHKRSIVYYGFWLVVLTFSSAMFWYTRPEGVWMLPFYTICFGIFIWNCKNCLRDCWIRIAASLLIPCTFVLIVGNYLASINERYYGIRVTHEFAEPNMVDAFRWLTRLAPESHRRHVPITSKAMEDAYMVSPHFALLKPYLSRQTQGRGWSKFGCEWMNICDDLAGGWSCWAIRDAAASIGVYSSAVFASKFYAAIAREIRQACENAELSCSNNQTGNFLAPPVTLTDIPHILISSGKMIVLAVTLGNFAVVARAWDRFHPKRHIVRRYKDVTHDQSNKFPTNYWRVAAIHFKTYSLLQVSGMLILMVVFFMLLLRAVPGLNTRWLDKTRWMNIDGKRWKILACTLILILSRIGIVGYVDAMSFMAQIRYLFVIYPPLMILFCLALPRFNFLSTKRNLYANK